MYRREQPRLTPEPVVRNAQRVLPYFRRTKPAQHSPGHRGDSSKLPTHDPKHPRRSAHQLRTRSRFTQAHSSRVPASRGLGRCGLQERRVEARALEKLVPTRSVLPLVTCALERPRRGWRLRGLCLDLCLSGGPDTLFMLSCGNDGGRRSVGLMVASLSMGY